MANRNKAAGAVKTPKAVVVSEKEARRTKAEAEDAQAKQDAQKQKASGPTAKQAAEERKEIDQDLVAQGIAEAEAVVRQREKFNAGLRQNVRGQYLISMTIEEEAEVQKFLADLRMDAQKKTTAGGVSKKRYLVNDNPGPVRMGGVTYNVPQGRHEITPEFLEEYFPGTVTADALGAGLLGGRFRVESDPEPEKKQAKAGEKQQSGTGKAQVGHGRSPANDLSTSTHPEATHLMEADRKNYLAGNGVR